jgi:ubiquinone/menaquinone biosynthesis C-methylase UbiE
MSSLRDFYEAEATKTKRYDSQSFWDSRYHTKRKDRILSILRMFPRLDTFLDIGCGTGEYLAEANKFSNEVVGVDLSKHYLLTIKKRGIESHLILADATALPFKDRSIECILCSETIEHIPNTSLAIREIARVNYHNVVISTPNFGLSRLVLQKISNETLRKLDLSVGHISLMSFNQLRSEIIKNQEKIIHEETLNITPPIIGEFLHVPVKIEMLVNFFEFIMKKMFPKAGNISLIVSEKI